MIAVDAIELVTGAMMGMNDRPFLNIMLCENSIQILVCSTLISIGPKHNRRMVHVSGNHLFNQWSSCLRGIGFLPTCQFINHINTQRITELQKILVGGIMAAAHCIHVHFFQQPNIHFLLFSAQASACLWPKTMTIDAFEFDLYIIDKNAHAFSDFNSPESELLPYLMFFLACSIIQCYLHCIQHRIFSCPCHCSLYLGCHVDKAVIRLQNRLCGSHNIFCCIKYGGNNRTF